MTTPIVSKKLMCIPLKNEYPTISNGDEHKNNKEWATEVRSKLIVQHEK